MKITLVKSKEMDQGAFDKLLGILKENGTISKDNGLPAKERADSIEKSFELSNKDYVKMCEENGLIPDGSHIEDEAERKGYVDALDEKQKAKVAKKERILTFRGSDETTDRHGDIVRVNGWDLTNYKKNPVFLAFHDQWNFPAGRTLRAWKNLNDDGAPGKKSLMFNVYFPEGNELSDTVYNAFNDGLMTSVSVGFRPLKYNYPADKEEREKLGLGQYGVEMLKQELFELSAVAVPANPNAIQIKSFDTKGLAERLGLKELPEAQRVEKEIQEQEPEVENENKQEPEVKEENEVSTQDALKAMIAGAEALKKTAETLNETLKAFQAHTKNLELKVELSAENLGIKQKENTEEDSENDLSSALYQTLLKGSEEILKATKTKTEVP